MFKFYRFLALTSMVLISACSDEGKDQTSAKDNSAVVSGDTAGSESGKVAANLSEGMFVSGTGEPRKSFQIEVADTQLKINRGLMGRTSIPEDYGMLFDVNMAPRDVEIAFWMMDTLIPLDMLFLDERGVVFFIHKNAQPNDITPIIPPKRPRAVLEINAGQADKYGINAGDMLKADLFGNK